MDETAEILENEGTFISATEYYGFRVSLYSLDFEFYEVYRDRIGIRIWKITQAREVDLNKYLKQIDLRNLLQKT